MAHEVTVTVPVRVADVGGWTDTAFGAPGVVCNIAVLPGVTVHATRQAAVHAAVYAPPHDATRAEDHTVAVTAPDINSAYVLRRDPHNGWRQPIGSQQPLIDQAIAYARQTWPIDASQVHVTISSDVPAGASLGTSASVIAGVLAALGALATGAVPDPDDLATGAYHVEAELVGRACGVQDHWAAAFGGIAALHIDPFPTVTRSAIPYADSFRRALEDQMCTVVFDAHDSSAVHHMVIAELARNRHGRGAEALHRLRSHCGPAAIDALRAHDIVRWAAVLREATEAQHMLHPALVGPAHRQAIDAVDAQGALGWKVNGAGGAGGSLTVVAESVQHRDQLVRMLADGAPNWRVLTHTISSGIHLR